MSILDRFRRYKEIIVLSDFSHAGGATRSVYTYYRHKVNEGAEDILLLRLLSQWGKLKLLLYSLFADRIILNGINNFYYYSTILVCLFHKNVIIYLHEDESFIIPFRKQHPFLHRMYAKALRRHKVAFVSQWQEDYYRKNYELGKTAIIYNAIPLTPEVPAGKVNIVMIAYQAPRKNVDFFSEVADRAAELGKNYQFHWVGGEGGNSKSLYHSPKVMWWGDQEQIMDLIDGFDMMLFPSKADTFGLVLVEALYKGLRVVTYKENGLAGFIQPLSGCRVFNTFDVNQVIHLMEEALKEPVDLEANRTLVRDLCSVEKLESRLDQLFKS